MRRRPPRSTQSRSSAASDVYKRQFYSKAKGCEIWDLDGNHYIDMSTMGIGSCIVGYGDDDIDDEVKKAIDNGNMSSLNAPEEVELAEMLCKIHPWADMVRFARTGGEAMAIAVRIARARSKKDIVLFSGYHGCLLYTSPSPRDS